MKLNILNERPSKETMARTIVFARVPAMQTLPGRSAPAVKMVLRNNNSTVLFSLYKQAVSRLETEKRNIPSA